MTDPILEAAIADRANDAPAIVGGADLRASWAGDCARKIGYKLRGEPETEPLSAQSAIAFAVGTAIHNEVQWALQRLYPEGAVEAEGQLAAFVPHDPEEESTVFPVKPWATFATIPTIGCHADFARPGIVTEIKSMKSYAFDKAESEGAQEHHILQAGLNGLAQKADVLEMIYVDKATGRIAVYTYADGWPETATDEALRLADVWATVRAGSLPAPIDPERKHWRCKYGCPFLRTCKKGE